MQFSRELRARMREPSFFSSAATLHARWLRWWQTDRPEDPVNLLTLGAVVGALSLALYSSFRSGQVKLALIMGVLWLVAAGIMHAMVRNEDRRH